ncbi:MAG: peptidylprolyl isomerase [bacterium]|nr:peptidylprolyl isomerase [bacterium]
MTRRSDLGSYFSGGRRLVIVATCGALIGACGGAREPGEKGGKEEKGGRPLHVAAIEAAERALVAGSGDKGGRSGVVEGVRKVDVGRAELGSNVIAVVAGEEVTVDEFTRTFPREALERMPDYIRRQYASFIDQLIENRVLGVAAEGEDFTGEPGYEEELAEAVRQVKMRYYYARHVSGGVKVSEEEIRRYYEDHQRDYTIPERVRVRHILVEVKRGAHPAEVSNAYERAVGLRQRVLEGEDFAVVAMRESSCPSRAQGGDLGYVERGQLVPEVERVAFKLRGNEVSGVVRSEFGYHIVQVTDRVAGRRRGLEEVREEIRDRLVQERERERYRALIGRLTNTYQVIRNEKVIEELVHRRW